MSDTGVVKKTHQENQRVITAAANITLNEVRFMDASSDCYPKIQEIWLETELFPPLLKYSIKHLVGPELKQIALSQCLTKEMRPIKVISSLLYGFSFEVDHFIGSKTFVELAKMGYSFSYDEVKRFK